MTHNEFKMYCILFCKENNGKTIGEVIPDIIDELKNTIVNFNDFHFQEYKFQKNISFKNLEYFVLFNCVSGYFTRQNGMLEYSFRFPTILHTEDIV